MNDNPSVSAQHKRYHPGNYPPEQCWHCQRARAICRTKIAFYTWDEAVAWAREYNESKGYKGDTLIAYGCQWGTEPHGHCKTARNAGDKRRVEKQRRKWLRVA